MEVKSYFWNMSATSSWSVVVFTYITFSSIMLDIEVFSSEMTSLRKVTIPKSILLESIIKQVFTVSLSIASLRICVSASFTVHLSDKLKNSTVIILPAESSGYLSRVFMLLRISGSVPDKSLWTTFAGISSSISVISSAYISFIIAVISSSESFVMKYC